PCFEVPARPVRAVAAPVAALVEVDDLRDLGQRGADRVLVQRMVGARPRVQQDDRRPLDPALGCRRDLRPVDVEEERDVPDGDPHRTNSAISSMHAGASRNTLWRAPSYQRTRAPGSPSTTSRT